MPALFSGAVTRVDLEVDTNVTKSTVPPTAPM